MMRSDSFYKELSYSNDLDYLNNNIANNFSQSEIIGKDILDYGCGTGDASFTFIDYMPKSITGIDIGESNIDICKKRNLKNNNIEFIRKDLNLCKLLPEQYDLVWSDTVIEFLTKDLNEIVVDFKECLRSDGVVYLSFTKKTFSNVMMYKILSFFKVIVPESFRSIFYYLIMFKYKLNGINIKDKNNVKSKVKYLFVPYIRLISETEIIAALENSGFQLQYIRERIKSDINSTSHIELKAILKNEQ